MNEFSFALLGDDTFARWGECAELRTELSRLYTRSTFEFANYGQNGSRVGHQLWRISNDCDGQKNLAYLNPDIIIIESGAFTQFWDGPEGLSEYRDLLRRIWNELDRTTTSQKLFCISAAPPRDRFLEKAPEFVGTAKATRARFADGVKMFLDEARAIAEDEGWPFADVDTEFARRVKEGESPHRFFDQSDSAAPSRFGYTLMARVMVREMDNRRFIEEKIVK
jgi:hypothetical protein